MKTRARTARVIPRSKTGKNKVKITQTVSVPKMRPTQKASVLSLVRKMMARDHENKRVGNEVEIAVAHNSAISGADCEPLVPQIVPLNDNATQSTTTMRNGDKIKPKSLTVRGVVSLKASNANSTAQDLYVRVVIAAQKSIKVGSQVLAGSVDANRLLKPGFATADQIQFTGLTQDLNCPLNTDAFRVYYDKTFKLHGPTDTSAFPVYSRRWSYRFKSLPAYLTFDDGNGDWPNNFAPFVAVGYAYPDGTAPDTVTTKVVSTTTAFLEFEDA